jgi:Methylase involved in ubiquinone/menaquinone biosynthesis
VRGPSYEFAHCVVCGHADATVIAEHEDLVAEVEALWAFHEKRLRAGTPPERLVDRVAFSERAPLRLVRCNGCGLVYRNPVERARDVAEIYTREAVAPEVLRSLHDTQLPALRTQARALRRVMGRNGSVLEVGCYVGAFLAAAREEGLHAEGIDVNAAANCFTRSMGFIVRDGELGDIDTDRRFDAVAIWSTFDQLVDPRGEVNAASKVLRAGGVLAVRVPHGAFYARMRRWMSQGRGPVTAIARMVLAQNNLLSFPYRWGFGVPSLRRLLGDSGFRIVRVRGDVLVPTADEWTRRWARVEESGMKAIVRRVARREARFAPWIEVYSVLTAGG